MERTILFETLEDQRVRCGVCQRRCVIAPGECGYCGTRRNEAGELYSLIYGQISSMRISPIEIKPLHHFYPGSEWLSMGSLGCNFRCPGCQNWEIAHADPSKKDGIVRYLPPEEAVQYALDEGCTGLSWTYNEPTLWLEYTLDSARLAKEKGLLTNYVTNGYMTPEALDLLGPYLDAFRVDLKGFNDEAYRDIAHIEGFQGILEVIQRARDRWGMHVEVVTNLIPGINDYENELRDLARWILDSLGEDTPWHVTRFIPHLKLAHLHPTQVLRLERARDMALEIGLRYVYVGNVPGHASENTYCPHCGKLVIERRNYRILQIQLRGNRCKHCHGEIAGRFREW
ncbi:MAG: AmmeMemoRadiSam system radical SAM enzyme [Deltaproteobacteria bacterium]|nr:AmmeMemoRadiSam system radical SAM enzyme [Deltaproteobacteria bacterium]